MEIEKSSGAVSNIRTPLLEWCCFCLEVFEKYSVNSEIYLDRRSITSCYETDFLTGRKLVAEVGHIHGINNSNDYCAENR